MTGNTGGGLTADACLTLLSNAHRRAVLLSIYDRGGNDAGSFAVEEIVSGSIPPRVEVALNHTHLPKLEDHDAIRWDRDDGTVGPGPAFEEVEPFIDCLEDSSEQLPDDWRSHSDN
ncbi:MAG: hypothetical protein R6U01_14550 [Halorubrum sp.]|uniref:DUF7344 domain-containing protein n=1 Tax=Halorubrum sp. TaxID=1879286 RepID=UPI00397091B7